MKFAIIDASSLFYRAQHVTSGDAFTKAGLALHLIFNILRKLRRELGADHMVFALNSRSWRYDVFPQYKASRKLLRLQKSQKEIEEDEVFREAFDDFADFISQKTKCTVLKSEKVEADDFVARWIQLHDDDEHIIVSGDSDFIQLLAPNVKIFDGINNRLISQNSVLNDKNEPLMFHIDPANAKLKVGKPIAQAKKEHDKAQKDLERQHIKEQKGRAERHNAEQDERVLREPGYKKVSYVSAPFPWVDFEFSVEDEWWKKALFIKCIRGDAGDGIFSAYPGVRSKGTSKKTGIQEAWEDRNSMGFNYNNLMLQRWSKLLEIDANGNKITKDVIVKDEYAFNRLLIDLTNQPDDIKNLMDTVIVQAVESVPEGNVGWALIKFCNTHSLPNIMKDAQDHGAYLNAGYVK